MSNIRTLILSDIHHKWEKAEKIIKAETPDKIVFLGDYQDDFGDDYRVAAETAEWLAGSLEQKNRIHIMGNHDVSYAFTQRSYKCSGYEAGKDYAISEILKESDWRKLPLYTWVGSWLCSHAGVHKYFYTKYGSGKEFKTWLADTCDEALNNAFESKPALPILRAGRSRGGIELHGGIDWCDVDEFEPIDGVNQIFGHTPLRKPTWLISQDNSDIQLDTKNCNYHVVQNTKNSRNLDLDVSHCNYYAIHNSNNDLNIEVKWIGDL